MVARQPGSRADAADDSITTAFIDQHGDRQTASPCPVSFIHDQSTTHCRFSSVAAIPHRAFTTIVLNPHGPRRPSHRLLIFAGGVDDALLDVAGEAEEGLLDVDVALRRDLHERYAQLVRQRLPLLGRDGALLLPVAIVAYDDLVDALGRVLLYVGEPGPDVCAKPTGSVSRSNALLVFACSAISGSDGCAMCACVRARA